MTNLRVAGKSSEEMTLTRKGKFFDYTLLIVVLFLIAFGLVMLPWQMYLIALGLIFVPLVVMEVCKLFGMIKHKN